MASCRVWPKHGTECHWLVWDWLPRWYSVHCRVHKQLHTLWSSMFPQPGLTCQLNCQPYASLTCSLWVGLLSGYGCSRGGIVNWLDVLYYLSKSLSVNDIYRQHVCGNHVTYLLGNALCFRGVTYPSSQRCGDCRLRRTTRCLSHGWIWHI